MAKLIDNYILVQTIFANQFIQKHKGRNLLTKESVFIKTIKIQKFYSDINLKQQTLNQINLLKKIKSDSIVKMIKMLKSSNNVYLIYQNIHNGGLQNYNGTFYDFYNMFIQMWRPLHQQKIIHGNLKPSSILFQGSKIKLKGFYCGRIGQTGKFYTPKVYIYSAPQIFQGNNTQKSDVFSLGLIMYELIYKKLPYSKDISINDLRLFWKKIQKIQLIKNSNLDPRLQQILSSMLEKNPKLRIDWDVILQKSFINTSNIQQKQFQPTLKSNSSSRGQQRSIQSNIDKKSLTSSKNNQIQKYKRLISIYGQKRNRVSILVGVLKQIMNLKSIRIQIQSIKIKLIKLLKQYSNELHTFVQQPSKILAWVDKNLQNEWKNSSFFNLVINNEFQDLILYRDQNEQIYGKIQIQIIDVLDIYNELRQIRFDDMKQKLSIKFCMKILSDLDLYNKNKFNLKGFVDVVQQQRNALQGKKYSIS